PLRAAAPEPDRAQPAVAGPDLRGPRGGDALRAAAPARILAACPGPTGRRAGPGARRGRAGAGAGAGPPPAGPGRAGAAGDGGRPAAPGGELPPGRQPGLGQPSACGTGAGPAGPSRPALPPG